MSLLITTSLLDAVDWCRKCPSSYKEDAYKQLSNQLNRIYPTPEPAPIKRGRQFEDAVYEVLEQCRKEGKLEVNPSWSTGFAHFVVACWGEGTFDVQHKVKSVIEVDGTEYLLWGKLDVMLPTKIIDLKACTRYKGATNYLSKAQHLIYCYVTNIADFEYQVAEFGSEEGLKILDTHVVQYRMLDRDSVKEEIQRRIRDNLTFIYGLTDLKEAYLHKFNQYN